MSELVKDSATVTGRPAEVWAILDDALALARVLPGAESIVADGPGRFHGVLASKIQFMTVRADVTAEFTAADPPRHVQLEMDGRPRGLAGNFRVSVPFDLIAVDGDERTRIDYSVDLRVTGRLATFGAPLMRATMRRQIAALVENVDRELARRRLEPSTAEA
jgi:carbon monoxide dehydrogenase subunit G